MQMHHELAWLRKYTFNPAYAPVSDTALNFAKCPSWLLGPSSRVRDEGEDIDAALDATDAPRLREQRQQLLHLLDSLQSLAPTDLWLTGQRVRFRLDQQDIPGALQVVQSCEDQFWCNAMRGLIAYQQGAWTVADSVFQVSVRALPKESRCQWTDTGKLLPVDGDPSPRTTYYNASCAKRDTLNAHYWWLADPLEYTSVNERRAEHYARRVRLLLRMGLSRDERYRWDEADGGSVVSEMLLRYGWPTVAMSLGLENDRGHNMYLARASAPYSTAEYSPGRVSFAPAFGIVLAPFRAAADAWKFGPPPGKPDHHSNKGPVWWPFEHMASLDTIAPLDQHQLAIFRRSDAVFTAIAARSETAAPCIQRRLQYAGVSALLLSSHAPDSMDVVGSASFMRAGHVVVSGYLADRPMVLGVEAAVTSLARTYVRLRRGVEPPPALSALAAGTVAISQPALFTPDSGGTPVDVHAMLPRLLPSTDLPRYSSVGVFWEAYGIPAGDSVTFTVAVTRTSGTSLLERIATATRLRAQRIDELAIAWSDPQRPTAVKVELGVPILPRGMRIDLQGLGAGTYHLTVEASTRAGRAVSEPREFTVVAK